MNVFNGAVDTVFSASTPLAHLTLNTPTTLNPSPKAEATAACTISILTLSSSKRSRGIYAYIASQLTMIFPSLLMNSPAIIISLLSR